MCNTFLDSHVSTMEIQGQKILKVGGEGLTMLAEQAMIDIAHLLRPAHLQVSISA